MKDNKPLYEKVYIWIGIIAGICAIFGISINKLLSNNTESNLTSLEDNKMETGDQSPIVIGDNNKLVFEDAEKEDIITLDVNDVTLNYAVMTDERFKDIYLIDGFMYNQYTDLSDPNNKYYVENNCATIMSISNQSNHEIKIDKYRIIVDEIKQNLEPVLSTSLIDCSNLDLKISNEGWSDISNLKITITDEKNLLCEYYDEKDLIYEISGLKIGETKTIHILDKSLMKKIPNTSSGDIFLYPIFNFISDEIDISKKERKIGIGPDGPYMTVLGGEAGTSVYGILINTDQESYKNECSINEYVDSGKIKDIPICFFPDKSCNLKFYVEFDIFDGYESVTIKSEPRYLEFKISSLPSEF